MSKVEESLTWMQGIMDLLLDSLFTLISNSESHKKYFQKFIFAYFGAQILNHVEALSFLLILLIMDYAN